MKLDQAGRLFIQDYEGFSSKPYLDQHGKWTIGYGHTEGVGENSAPITKEEAEKLFDYDLEPTERLLNRSLYVAVTQNQYNALVSFGFNEGITRLIHSTLLHRVNAGDNQGASREFLRWVWYQDKETKEMKRSDGLTRRRKAEMDLFLTPGIAQTG